MPLVNSIAFTTCNKLMKFKLNTFIEFLFPLLLAWQNYALATPILVPPTVAETPANPERNAFLPLPAAPDLSAEKVALGKRLFFEKRLSHDDTIACSSCHDFARGGADRLPVSIGIQGKSGQINAPTVFNASLNFVQFWDGRASSLEEQAAGPVLNPLEMGSNWQEVIPKLMADEQYRVAFTNLYSEGISGKAVMDAIASYERTLLTPSRFDKYLNGDTSMLNETERAGYQAFMNYGCASCHQGANIGGNMYSRFGVMEDYFKDRNITEADLGRYNVTHREEDRYVFKVPSLRNVALTPPYFHNGQEQSLEKAIKIMGRFQLGRELPEHDIVAIAAFLCTLTGEWEGRLLQ